MVLLSQLNGLAENPRNNFFDRVDKFFGQYVVDGKIDYQTLQNYPTELKNLTGEIAIFNLQSFEDGNNRKAFWIDAYNVLVIQSVVKNWPLESPKDVPGFFDRIKHSVSGKKLTLNEIERTVREKYGDPRIHFALVCAALSCPPILNKAYRGSILDKQLDRQTRKNLNNPDFVKVLSVEKKVEISPIFEWYRSEFLKKSNSIIEFLNMYRTKKIPGNFKVTYSEYDWNVNQIVELSDELPDFFRINLQSYTPSRLLRPGEVEGKWFNNLYSQTAFFGENSRKKNQSVRSSYFTGIFYFLVGIHKNLNIGFDLYFKSVKFSGKSSSPFDVLNFSNQPNRSRTALASLGPKIKISPFANWKKFGFLKNLAVQTVLLFPVASNLENKNSVFLDFDAKQWWTQFFYDQKIAEKWLVYLESGFYVRFSSHENGFTSPFKTIVNYYPGSKSTLYFVGELAPGWSGFSWSSYYFQAGLGAKYQISPNLEIETLFTNFFFGKQSGAGSTYNLGFRFIL